MKMGRHELYEELSELARSVENAMKAISVASPQITSSATQLPIAASHLADLSKMTEDGTMEVMCLTETVQVIVTVWLSGWRSSPFSLERMGTI